MISRRVRIALGFSFLLLLSRDTETQGTWSTVASMPAPRYAHTGAELDGLIHVVGGVLTGGATCSFLNGHVVYDPVTNTWSPAAAMSSPRVNAAAAALDGLLYVAGGDTTCSQQTPGMEAYDPATGTWAMKAPMPTRRSSFALVPLGGRLYAIGGIQFPDVGAGPDPLNIVEVYDPAAGPQGAWTTLAPMPHRRHGLVAAAIDGLLYVTGGGSGADVNTVDVFDPGTNTWSSRAPIGLERFGSASAVIHGRWYVAGGSTAAGFTASVEIYNPASDTWTFDAPLPAIRAYMPAAAVNGLLYVPGGFDGVNNPTAATYVLSDSSPPVTTATPSVAPNGNGWNNSDVTVALDATDADGGVQSITYSLAGAQTGGATVLADTVAFPITAEGTTTITFHATDVSGNVEPDQVRTIRIDRTAPTLSVPNGISVFAQSSAGAAVVFSATGSDALSGVVSTQVTPLSSGMIFPLGLTHETVTVMDAAGNTSVAGFDVTVHPARPNVNISGGTFVADGNPHGASASATDSFGTPVAGALNVTYGPGGAFAPVAPGRYSATASFFSSDPAFTSVTAWTAMAPDPNRKQNPAIGVINGRLYVVGFDRDDAGNPGSFVPRLSIYDPATNTWSTGPAPSLVRTYVSSGVIDGKLYVAGGCISADCGVGTTNALEIFDPVANSWSTGAPLNTARFGAATGVIGGRLIVSGGTRAPFTAIDTTEIYDPVSNTWSSGAAVPASRELPASAVINGLLYVMGGYQRGLGADVARVDVYNPVANSWSTRSPMSAARSSAVTGVVNGVIHVIGGHSGSAVLDTHEFYDPIGDVWFEGPAMPTARTYAAAGVVNSKLYVIDGTNGPHLGANEALDPSLTTTITITGAANNSPAFVHPTPFAPLSVQAGSHLSFTVRASDADAGDLVSIAVEAATLPAGSTSNGNGPANPADRTFDWTPAAGDVGSHTVVFTASDNRGGVFGPLSVTINVTPAPPTLTSISVSPSTATISVGQSQSFQAIAHFSDGSTQVLPVSSGGGSVGPNPPMWQLDFVGSDLNVSVCATPQYPAPITFSGQNFADRNGSINETWSAGTPVVTVTGTITPLDVSLSLACTNGAATGTIDAHWQGTRYVGTYSFNGGASTGSVSISGWSGQANMSVDRFNHGAAAVNARVYVVGGVDGFQLLDSVESYDPSTNTWSLPLAPMPTPRDVRVAALNGLIYAVGGQVTGGAPTGILEAYNPATNTWTTGLAPMPTPRGMHAVVTDGTYLYAVGGIANEIHLATVERYDPSTNTWATLAPMPRAGGFIAAGVLDGTIVVIGAGGSSGPTSITDLYDIATNTWRMGAPMPAARTMMSAGVANGGLYVFGGTVNGSQAYDTWVYYAATPFRPDGWAGVGSMLTARSQAAAAVVDNVVYALGGMTGGAPPVPGLAVNEALSTPPPGTFATSNGSNGLPNVQWQSSNTFVAGINASGSATGQTPGTVTITAIASNGMSCATSVTCATLTVSDTTPPMLSLPNNQTREANNSSGAMVTYFVSAFDSVDGQRPVSCNPPSGSTFPFGPTTVSCSASDLQGNTATGSFVITVQDTNPPFLNIPFGNQARQATSPAGAIVTYGASASDSVDGSVPITCSPASGSQFPFGPTTVNCSATDAHGNTRNGSFTIVVEDTNPPFMSNPGNPIVDATGALGAVVDFTVTANDTVDGPVPVTCSPASGSLFAIGVTTVTCSASDSRGNTRTGSFTVTVVPDTTPPVVQVLSPQPDDLVATAPAVVDVTVQVFDTNGASQVAINGVGAVMTGSNGAQSTWRASLSTPAGVALSIAVAATDQAGNIGHASIVVDNDGIASAIDRSRTTGADRSSVYSSEFNDGTTAGTITRFNNTQVTAVPDAGTVRVTQISAGNAWVAACSGNLKYVLLNAQGEGADVSCASTGTVTVTARVSSGGVIELYKSTQADVYFAQMRCFFLPLGLRFGGQCSSSPTPVSYYYSYRVSLPNGQTASTGSPVTASADNTQPIGVTLLQIDDAGNEFPVGSFELDPGESADVTVTQGANRQDLIEFSALLGEITVTLGGVTQTVSEGQEVGIATDLTAPTVVLSSTAADPARSAPIAVTATFSEPVVGFDPGMIVVTNATVSGFAGAGATYTFNLEPIAEGPVMAAVPAGAALDAAGMASLASNVLARTYVPNVAPVCSAAAASPSLLWPVNHAFVPIDILGIVDPDGDPFTVSIASIFQDEPTNGSGDANTSIDGYGLDTERAWVRAERSGKRNGRVYHIRFTATDGAGLSCAGEVTVGVPQGNNGESAVDEGRIFDSTRPTTPQEEAEHIDCEGHNHTGQ